MAVEKKKLSTTGKKAAQLINQTVTGIYEDAVNRKNLAWFPNQDQTKFVDSTIVQSTMTKEAKTIADAMWPGLTQDDRDIINELITELPKATIANYEKIVNDHGTIIGMTPDYKYDADPYSERIGSSRVGNLTVPTYASFIEGRRMDKNISGYAGTNNTYSMCDIVCTIDIGTINGEHVYTVLGKLQTLSYSIYQQKQPVRVLGNMNAKDYVYGQRTIAGSLVFAVFNRHWLVDIYDQLVNKGMMKNWHYIADEIPPFDITISFANEYGYDSKMALYGVRLMTEGQVMSINDIYIENTYQFVAIDIEYMDALNAWQKTDKIGRRWTDAKGQIKSNENGNQNMADIPQKIGETPHENAGEEQPPINSIQLYDKNDLKEFDEAEMLSKLQQAYFEQRQAMRDELEKAKQEKNTEKTETYERALEQLAEEYKNERNFIRDYYAKQKVDKAKT